MEHEVMLWVREMLTVFSLPTVGLPGIFVVALVSATLLPLGSEPVVIAYLKVAPDMFWPAMVLATAGNTIGGVITYYMGKAAKVAYEKIQHKKALASGDIADETGLAVAAEEKYLSEGDAAPDPQHQEGGRWHDKMTYYFDRFGPAALLFSWLPVVGDPLCGVAGWMRLSIVSCIVFMTIGKFLRYLLMTSAVLWIW